MVLSEVVTLKYSKKKKLQNNGKFQEFFLFLKKEKKKTQKITPPIPLLLNFSV
jgi:hypothetical protein